MKSRMECIPLEEALRLGSEMGIREAQAGKNAFRMLAHHPDLVRHVYGLLIMLSTRNKLDARLRELIINNSILMMEVCPQRLARISRYEPM